MFRYCRETGTDRDSQRRRAKDTPERGETETDREGKRERLSLYNPGRINSKPGSAHNCPGVATPLPPTTPHKPFPLSFDVPKGSVLGPHPFILYTRPLSHLIKSSFPDHHRYADDIQLGIPFYPSSFSSS